MPIVHGRMEVFLWKSGYKEEEIVWKEIICQKRNKKKLKEAKENDIKYHPKTTVAEWY